MELNQSLNVEVKELIHTFRKNFIYGQDVKMDFFLLILKKTTFLNKFYLLARVDVIWEKRQFH